MPETHDSNESIADEVMNATETIRALQSDIGYLADVFDTVAIRRRLAFANLSSMEGIGVMADAWAGQLRSICESLNEMEAQTDGFRAMVRDGLPDEVILSEGYECHPVRAFAYAVELGEDDE